VHPVRWIGEHDERRMLRRLRRTLASAGVQRPDLAALDDSALADHVADLRERWAGAAADDPPPPLTRAVLDEVVRRTLGLTVHDEQWVAVLAMTDGWAVQLDTGEGKTLVGALAATLECWRGRRPHIATVNDYLAGRDAAWMGPVYRAAGLTAAAVTAAMAPEQRRAAHGADVVYAPLTQIGFDLLRDGLAERPADRVLPGLDHLVVDEIDSLLVDQARIPLVVAGAWGERDGVLVARAAQVVGALEPGADYEADDGRTAVWLTDRGVDRVQRAFDDVHLYDTAHTDVLTAVNLALHARVLVERDVDYLVVDGRIRLVDTSRGRVAHLRRWPDGLQEAVEVREGLTRSEAGVVLDQTTVPALVRAFRSVVGMSGTADGAREELDALYRLRVVRVPPHRRSQRVDEPLRVYADAARADAALVARTAAEHTTGRPVLVGTQSVAESEHLATLLAALDVPHVVLNAKNDSAEAELVALAGRSAAVTVSTQMAGRGTDIVLGEQVAPVGGLLVLARGLYPSSRLDDQLRGRAGRQGDPGGSAVYAALDDDLVLAAVPDAPAWADAADEDGLVDERGAVAAVQHAQRVAEGAALASVRDTWRYHAIVAAQREAVQAAREAIIAAGDDDLPRRARLAVLDHAWSDHLGLLTDLRESVHLRVMARMNPWLSFNADAEAAFATLIADTQDEADSLLAAHPDAADLAGLGLRRPSATWTYVLHDMTLGDDMDRAVRGLRRVLGLGREPDRPAVD